MTDQDINVVKMKSHHGLSSFSIGTDVIEIVAETLRRLLKQRV